jgi:hypothetical protein
MTSELTPGHQVATSPIPAQARSRGRILAWMMLGLLPVSALAVFVVLHLMAASSAAVTGGCGGG